MMIDTNKRLIKVKVHARTFSEGPISISDKEVTVKVKEFPLLLITASTQKQVTIV